jgi:hypothetical protein
LFSPFTAWFSAGATLFQLLAIITCIFLKFHQLKTFGKRIGLPSKIFMDLNRQVAQLVGVASVLSCQPKFFGTDDRHIDDHVGQGLQQSFRPSASVFSA